MKTPRQVPEATPGKGRSGSFAVIFQALASISLLTVLAKLLGAVKEAVVAAQFGPGDLVDAYLIAFVLPSFLFTVLAQSFRGVLIPVLVRARLDGGEQPVEELMARAMSVGVWILAGGTGILIGIGPFLLPLLGSGFDPAKLQLVQRIYWVLVPTFALHGFVSIRSAVLHSQRRFTWAFATESVVPVAQLLAVVFLARSLGIQSLAWGLVAGLALQAILVEVPVSSSGFKLEIRSFPRDSSLRRRLVSEYLHLSFGSCIMGSTVMVDQVMAASLVGGSVSALGYGTKLISFVLKIGSVSLATALLPFFSQMVAARQWRELRDFCKSLVFWTFTISIPLVALIFWFSNDLVSLVFQRGQFTAEDTELVGRIQAMYAIQIPFYTGGLLAGRLLTALLQTRVLIIGSAISLIMNITLNYLLMQWLGVVGISLSTSLVRVLVFFFLTALAFLVLSRAQAGQLEQENR